MIKRFILRMLGIKSPSRPFSRKQLKKISNAFHEGMEQANEILR